VTPSITAPGDTNLSDATDVNANKTHRLSKHHMQRWLESCII